MKKIFVFMIVALFSFTVDAQNFEIIVLDDESGEKIRDASAIGKRNIYHTDNGILKIPLYDSVIDVFAANYKHKILKLTEDSLIYTVKLKPSYLEIDEIIVSANKWEQKSNEVSISVIPVNLTNIDLISPQTTADLLGSNSRVFIQKSQLGGGSPMLRGFAANRVLLVVDGVRMNNAIFRSGNLQNIISIDANSLAEAEIILGPGSVIYGSDAIGGVMDFHTKQPVFANGDKNFFEFNGFSGFSSADLEKKVGFDFNIGTKKFASRTMFSYSDFSDLKMGTKGPEEYLRPEYVEIINGNDSIVKNANPLKQIYSGYSAYFFNQKFAFKLKNNLKFSYDFYFSTTSDVPRYDRLIQYSSGHLKYAEWYYGPQKWIMHRIALETEKGKFWDNMRIVGAFQDYTESRHDRKLNADEIRERTENVKVLSLNLDASKSFNPKNTIFYGLETTYNLVHSTGILRNIHTGATEEYASRYPDGSTYSNFDLYLQMKSEISGKLILNYGARFSKILLHADFDTVFYKFPYDQISLSPSALTGSVGLVYLLPSDWNFSINFANGFRSPNIDDIGKVFDSEPGNVIVPNPDLKPEYIYDFEIGIHKTHSSYFVNATVFYSYLDNAMVRSDFTFNGQDSIMYDGTLSKVQALVNEDYAVVYGVQVDAGVQVTDFMVLKTGYSYLKGYDKSGNPLRHVPPPLGNTHLKFFVKKFVADLYFIYSAGFSFDELAPSEQDKPHIYAIDENGNPYSPAWETLNFKLQYSPMKQVKLTAGVENILDERYRPYSSGIVAPGRNFVFSLRFFL